MLLSVFEEKKEDRMEMLKYIDYIYRYRCAGVTSHLDYVSGAREEVSNAT